MAKASSLPDTPPDELRRLHDLAAQDYENYGAQQPLIETIAAHPNSPPDLLSECLYRAPEAFLRNPALPLLPLESPDFFERLSVGMMLHLLSFRELPLSIVRLLGASSEQRVVEAARHHIVVAGEAGEDWEAEVHAILMALPMEHIEEYRSLSALRLLPEWMGDRGLPAPPQETPEIPAPEMSWRAVSLRHIVFPETPRTPPPGGWETLRLKDVAARIVLARDVTLPPEGMLALAGDRQGDVRIHLAKNPMATPEVLMRLAGTGQKIDELVAIHPNATAPVLQHVIDSGYAPDMAMRILRRPCLNVSTLAVLAGHNDPDIRRIVYHHPLSRRKDGSLRPGIARRLQEKTLGYRLEQATYPWHEENDLLMDFIVLSQSGTRVRILKAAAETEHWLRRLAVAQHPNTPRKLRQRLAEREGNRYVRAAARQALRDDALPEKALS